MNGNDSYDPLSFGQVRVGGSTKTPAPGGQSSPEDILFETTESASAPSGARKDTSWEMLKSEADEFLPRGVAPAESFGSTAQFEEQILNEKPVQRQGSKPATPRLATRGSGPNESRRGGAKGPDRTPTEVMKAAKTGAGERMVSQPRPEELIMPAASLSPGGASSSKQGVGVPVQDPRLQPKRPFSQGMKLAPAIVLASGLVVGGYFHLFMHNFVFACLSAALGLVGAAFARIWLRS